MYFELWDVETKNLLYDFDTQEEAVDAARKLVSLNPGVYPEKLALAQVDDGDTVTWLGAGATLQPLLDARPVHPVERSA